VLLDIHLALKKKGREERELEGYDRGRDLEFKSSPFLRNLGYPFMANSHDRNYP